MRATVATWPIQAVFSSGVHGGPRRGSYGDRSSFEAGLISTGPFPALWKHLALQPRLTMAFSGGQVSAGDLRVRLPETITGNHNRTRRDK